MTKEGAVTELSVLVTAPEKLQPPRDPTSVPHVTQPPEPALAEPEPTRQVSVFQVESEPELGPGRAAASGFASVLGEHAMLLAHR